MIKNRVIAVRIRKGDLLFHVHGEQAGAEGVWLAEGQVQGLYDAPVKTTWKTGAFQVGSRYKGKKREHRDLILGFHIADTATTYEFNESQFRQAFQYELDPWDPDHSPTTIEVVTELSGTRKLDVLMFENPEFEASQDPIMQQYGNLIMKLRAGNPDWYSDDYTYTFSSTSLQASGYLMVQNPTDQVAHQKLVLTRANWVVPDCQWVGPPAARTPGGEHADRVLADLNLTGINGGAILDWDRSQLAFRDTNNTNLQAQIGQRFLVYPIPPQTPPTPLPISYTSAFPGGAAAQLIIPQRWSRPWGMELIREVNYQTPLGTTRFMIPGEWSYEIPPGATHLDVLMLGGGGGGGASGVLATAGGSGANWVTTTLVRGQNLAAETTHLFGQVGAGGKGGQKEFNILPGLDGTPSTCSAVGMDTIVAAGGKGSGNAPHNYGDGVPSVLFNGIRYPGAASQTKLGATGNPAGGAGAAGFPFTSGGDGARGQVWIRAYQLSTQEAAEFVPDESPTVIDEGST